MTTTDWIQALSAVAIVILTFVLVMATIKYVRHTKKMADIMARELEAKGSAFLEMEIVSRSHSASHYTITGSLSNYGFFTKKFYRLELVWWFSDDEEKKFKKEIEFKKTLGPGEKNIRYTLNLSDSEILDKRKELKNYDDWLARLHNLVRFRVVAHYAGPLGLITEKVESSHHKIIG